MAKRKREVNTAYADAISALLKKSGKNQGWLAKQSGLTRSAVSDILRGEVMVGLQTLEKMADAFSVPVARLTPGGDQLDQSDPYVVARQRFAALIQDLSAIHSDMERRPDLIDQWSESLAGLRAGLRTGRPAKVAGLSDTEF